MGVCTLGTQKLNRLKKALALLLAVLFVVSLTAVATSAAPCKGPIPDCKKGYHTECVKGHWRCVPNQFCKGPIPLCIIGYHLECVKGHWKCVPNEKCRGPSPICPGGNVACVNGHWKCQPLPTP